MQAQCLFVLILPQIPESNKESSKRNFIAVSGRVMEKCGLKFVQYGEFQKLDGSCKIRAMEYEM